MVSPRTLVVRVVIVLFWIGYWRIRCAIGVEDNEGVDSLPMCMQLP